MKALSLILLLVFGASSGNAWEIDLSRRRKQLPQQDLPGQKKQTGDAFVDLFASSEPAQELVILNTERGFVPAKVSLKKGSRYIVHLVNVNDKEKNVSFILDAFTQHHATFFGKIKTFELRPAQEGVFSYQCPETNAEGRMVVFSPEGPKRALATESKE